MISGFAQDSVGNIWLSTWNGLCKFDGETFTTYTETSTGEKVGRLGLVRTTRQGRIWVIRQSDSQEYLFNPETELLDTIPKGSVKQQPTVRLSAGNGPDSTGLVLVHDSATYCIPYEGAGMTNNSHFNSFIDRQGNIWANFDDALYQITFDKATYEHIEWVDPQRDSVTRFGDEIRAMVQLRDGGFLLGCKNGCIYKYNEEWQFEGYLTPEGEIVQRKTPFGARIYCFKQASDGSLWMGSRGHGIYYVCSPQLDRQIQQKGYKPSVRNYQTPFLRNDHIFDLTFIDRNRLVVATWDGGVQLLHIDASGHATNSVNNDKIRKVRRILVIHENLIALCSTQGIFLVDNDLQVLKQLGTMDFSDLCQSTDGTFYASSLSGGVYTFQLSAHTTQQELDSLKLHETEVKEIDNIFISIAQTNDGTLWFVSDNRIVKYNPDRQSAQMIDREAFGSEVIFGEAQPMALSNHLMLGTNVGRMQINLDSPEGYCPMLTMKNPDTLQVEWGEEIPEIRATAIDFRLPRLIQYAWRELPDTLWTPLGETGVLQLGKLWPGTHSYEIRSTDAKEVWADNIRTVVVVVSLALWHKLTFGAIFLLFLLFSYAIWRSNHRQPNKFHTQAPVIGGIQPTKPVVVARDQQFIEQVTKIVEEHIDDPQLDVEMLTTYMNTSRTILYGKFKELLDATPAGFITEIRLKRAIQLLETREYRVNEVAVMCGFTDPKYFTRHFKQRMGVSPAKYLELKK